LISANPDRSYALTGKVAAGSVQREREKLRFTVTDRDGSGSVPVRYEGTVPDPFREGREVVLTGKVVNGTFIGERDTLSTKCPSKFSAEKNQ
jgi:cytochrome c-type biogenesis protein CcmE